MIFPEIPPEVVIIQNCQKMVTRIKKAFPQTIIYYHTLFPTNSSFGKSPNHYGKEAPILAVNKALRELIVKGKFTFIDLYTPFLG